MSTSGYLLRRDQAQAAASAAPCEGCGHPHAEHRELAPSWRHDEEAGELIEVPHPDYKPFVFHCHHEGCNCILDNR